jgi:hypothetical protein
MGKKKHNCPKPRLQQKLIKAYADKTMLRRLNARLRNELYTVRRLNKRLKTELFVQKTLQDYLVGVFTWARSQFSPVQKERLPFLPALIIETNEHDGTQDYQYTAQFPEVTADEQDG